MRPDIVFHLAINLRIAISFNNRRYHAANYVNQDRSSFSS
jgi:hypothetical protein